MASIENKYHGAAWLAKTAKCLAGVAAAAAAKRLMKSTETGVSQLIGNVA
jgi:hypothetical protein